MHVCVAFEQMRLKWRGTGRCVHFPCLSQQRLPPPPSAKTRAAMTWSGTLRWEQFHAQHPCDWTFTTKIVYQKNVSLHLMCCLSPHLSSLHPSRQSKYLLLSPPNPKALVLCPMANQASTQAPSLKLSLIASNPRLPRAAALSRPRKARHSPYPPSRKLHLQPRYDLSPRSCPPPKMPAWVNPRP